MAKYPSSVPPEVGSNLPFLKEWSRANEQNFVQVMEILRDESPAKYAELFLKVQEKIIAGTAKTDTKNINITVNNEAQAKLRALAGMNDPVRKLEYPNKTTEYAEFTEISNI